MPQNRSQKKHSRSWITKLPIPVSIAFFLGCSLGFISHESLNPAIEETPHKISQARVWFSPKGNCTQKIVRAIHNAKKSILVMAYSFTCPQIGQALINAHLKGVEVKILIDRSQLKDHRSQCRAFLKHGLSLWVDPASGIAHNKVMVFDENSVLTGSFNFTRNAELRNAENVLVVDCPALAKKYILNWNQRASLARKISGPKAKK